MSRFDRNVNIAAVVIPFLATVLAAIFAWGSFLHWRDVVIFAVMYLTSAFGVTIGFHRHLTHRAFETFKPVHYALAIMGSLAVEGPVLAWVADHRKHHTFSDEEGDPHSPHVDHGAGVTGVMRGLYHAHIGWLFESNGRAEKRRYCPDLYSDSGMRAIHRAFPWIVGATLLIPFAAGYAWGGTLSAGLEALLWAGLVRIFLVHHVTWSINSICHFVGQQRFETGDQSRNVFWLALPSLGEAWHHNHHAFPRSAYHGLRWYELDPSGWVIFTASKLGLVWNVVAVDRERQHSKLAAAVH
ncbi:MAG: fatty acid desaturase [Solirubrobacteraceae bacterium]|jgi:stearoyl-CoA desaturase (delta-9 desaturase)